MQEKAAIQLDINPRGAIPLIKESRDEYIQMR